MLNKIYCLVTFIHWEDNLERIGCLLLNGQQRKGKHLSLLITIIRETLLVT